MKENDEDYLKNVFSQLIVYTKNYEDENKDTNSQLNTLQELIMEISLNIDSPDIINDILNKRTKSKFSSSFNNGRNIDKMSRNNNENEINDFFIYCGVYKKNDVIDENSQKENENNETCYNVYIRYSKNPITNKLYFEVMLDDIRDIIISHKLKFETELKSKILSKIAHEFKTPLIVIMNLISDTLDKKTNINETLNKISKISDYITFLISDIISFMNNKTFEVEKTEVNIPKLISEIKEIGEALINVLPGNKSNLIFKEFTDSQMSNYFVITDQC